VERIILLFGEDSNFASLILAETALMREFVV